MTEVNEEIEETLAELFQGGNVQETYAKQLEQFTDSDKDLVRQLTWIDPGQGEYYSFLEGIGINFDVDWAQAEATRLLQYEKSVKGRMVETIAGVIKKVTGDKGAIEQINQNVREAFSK